MEPAEYAVNAEGETVTPDRLDPPVVDALGGNEQPHYLLRGESFEEVSADSRETNRLFPRVNDAVSTVATDQRVLVVVPQSATTETCTVDYEEITDVTVENGQFPELHIETSSGAAVVNFSESESPDSLVAYIDEQRTDGETETPEERESDTSSPVETSGDSAGPLEQIERLAALREQGIVTEEEFEQKKQQLLEQV
jgi:hypothetical protein